VTSVERVARIRRLLNLAELLLRLDARLPPHTQVRETV
jgi:hypothetical protein